jgi:orotate phosphoribosyltransferase
MHLLPTQDEIVRVLNETGALRHGHFELPNGKHTSQFLQLPLALRYYQHNRTFSVALSRLLRANPEISSQVSELSVVAPASGGLPLAFGVSEALRCHQVYWAENEEGRLRFRQYMEDHQGEKVVIVDDTLRTGRKLRELKALLESKGAAILAVAVVIYQPYGSEVAFEHIPLYTLARLEAELYPDAAGCRMCQAGEGVEKVRV